jgi:hypothetical protein
MIELTTGKNIAPNRGGRLRSLILTPFVRRRTERDRVVEVEPARLQQAVDGLEIRRVMATPKCSNMPTEASFSKLPSISE